MKVQIYALQNPNTLAIGYVGMTTVNYLSRYGSHLASAYNENGREYPSFKYVWFRDMVTTTGKFPLIKLLEEVEVESLQEAYLLEAQHIQKWSKEYTLCNRDNIYTTRPIFQHTLEGILVKEWGSVIDIIASGELERKDIGNLMQCVERQRKSLRGFMWTLHKTCTLWTKEKSIPAYEKNKSTKEIHMYSIEGDYIKSFKGAREVVGYNYKNVSQVCVGEKMTHKERRFSFEKVEKLPLLRGRKKNDMSKLRKPLLCFDLKMNYIREYYSCKEVADVLGGVVDSGTMSKAARGLCDSYRGFIWRYK